MIRHPRLRFAAAALATLALATVLSPASALAHADLTSSDPANGASVTGPLTGPLIMQFSEALRPGSRAELLNAGGTRVAEAGVDAANAARMAFTLASPLPSGKYTIQWTSVAADKDVHRGQVTFTVVDPTPAPGTPTPAPTATAAPTAAPSAAPTATAGPSILSSPSAAPVASPSPATGDRAPASATDAIIPVIAALALVAFVGFTLLRRGRSAS